MSLKFTLMSTALAAGLVVLAATSSGQAPSPPPAGTWRPLLREHRDFFLLAEKADAIVSATVEGSRSYWAPVGNLILTEHFLRTTETLKGEAPATFSVVVEGGVIGDLELRVCDELEFEPRSSYALMLERGASGMRVLGGPLGATRLSAPEFPKDAFLRDLQGAIQHFNREGASR